MVPAETFTYTCPQCGKNLDFIYDYERIAASCGPLALNKDHELSIWRYLPLLPVKNSPVNRSLRIGGTPLVSFPDLAQKHGLKSLQFKDDSRNPSGSLKDRASELAIQHAQEQGQMQFHLHDICHQQEVQNLRGHIFPQPLPCLAPQSKGH